MLSPSLAFNQQQQTISPNPEQPNTSSDKAATSPSTGASVDSSSKLVQEESPSSSKSDHESTSVKTACSLYTAEQQKLYERRYEEGYDVQDPEYEAWLKITHPMDTRSVVSSSASVKMSNSASSCSDILHEMLVLPEPKQASKKKKKGLNAKCVCITEESVLDNLKAQKAAKEEEKLEKEKRKIEREEKKKAKALEMERRNAAREEKRKAKELERERKKIEKEKAKEKRGTRNGRVEDDLQHLTVRDVDSSVEEDRAVCPICRRVYPDDGGFWVACDGCDEWFDLPCTDIETEEVVPDTYYCQKCRV